MNLKKNKNLSIHYYTDWTIFFVYFAILRKKLGGCQRRLTLETTLAYVGVHPRNSKAECTVYKRTPHC